MPTPINADDPPGFSTTWGTPPDDGTDAKAAHIRQLALILLTNCLWLRREILRHEETHTAAEDSSTKVWTSTSITANGAKVDVSDCEVGDVLEVSASAHTNIQADGGPPPSAAGGFVYLYATDNVGTGTPTAMTGNRRGISQNLTAGTVSTNMAFNGTWPVAAAGTTRIELRGKVNNAADEIQLLDWTIVVKQLRPT